MVTTQPGVKAKEADQIPIEFKLKSDGLFGLPSTASSLVTNKYLIKTSVQYKEKMLWQDIEKTVGLDRPISIQ